MLVKALRIGEKIHIKKLQKALLFTPALKEPYIIKYEKDKYLVIFKYGVLVYWGLSEVETNKIMAKIGDYIELPTDEPNKEEMKVKIGKRDQITTDCITLSSITAEKVAIISEVLSRSVAMEHFEMELENVLSAFGEITNTLSKGGTITLSNRALLKKVGFAMNIQHLIVNQLAMLDKPEITWDFGDLDQFFNQLIEEYEINERYKILNQKLEMIFRDVEFIMNYIDAKKNLWLEVTIVILIVIEIVLFVAELFWLK